MRPALQRLLQRPGSFDLLRYLVGTPSYPPALGRRQCSQLRRSPRTQPSVGSTGANSFEESNDNGAKGAVLDEIEASAHVQIPPIRQELRDGIPIVDYGPWNNLSPQIIAYESELEDPLNASERPSRLKLLDNSTHRQDARLWACLLDYKHRTQGLDGVFPFWEAVMRGDLVLPLTGPLANKFWKTFLKLGFRDERVLKQIIEYAQRTVESTGKHWPQLYTTVIQHFLLSGCASDDYAWHKWHYRMYPRYAPKRKPFKEMCRQVAFRKGNMSGLLRIYTYNNYRDLYSAIVPTLCSQGDFVAARKWHFDFLKVDDVPTSSEDVEPLLRFLLWYNPQYAVDLANSLVGKAIEILPGSKLSSGLSKHLTNPALLKEDLKVSRVMMNLIHGENFGITAKEYNDNYGAKWFATTWISLDISINTVGALGMDWIGPLSLQAIALREQDAEKITSRINQLQDIGISIGKSLYSRAVEFFARNKKQELLDTLLASDLHPDVLEDRNVQEDLMNSYARAKDWPRYRLTLALRFLASKSDPVDTHNIMLRSYSTIGDTSAMLIKLRKMQMEGTPVQAKTVRYLMTHVLRRRRRGKRPMTQDILQARDDLDQAIELLKGIMLSGSFVPVTFWREILKRLGMLLRLDDLAALCDFLATWYGPTCEAMFLDPKAMDRWHRYQTPDKMLTSHPLHPLMILFSPSLQSAIVEWGFIKSLDRDLKPWERTPKFDVGIQILKRLNQRGVYIYFNTLRNSIFDRLVLLYGTAQSNRLRNRVARNRNPLELNEMVHQIHEAVGRQLFKPRDLLKNIRLSERTRIMRRHGKRPRFLKSIDPYVLRMRDSAELSQFHVRKSVVAADEEERPFEDK